MKVKEVLDRINFKVGNLDDITGKAVNPIISNYDVILELNSQLRQYANITKGIQDVWSVGVSPDVPTIAAPTLALRSESYFYAFVISNGAIYPMDMRNQQDVFPVFRFNPVQGITNWIMPWGAGKSQYLTFYPSNSLSPVTSTLTSDISPTDTTISVTTTGACVARFGRITIGTEKIFYEYIDGTHFYGCQRGQEMTIASAHLSGSAYTENNVWLFYARLPIPVIVTDKNFVSETVLNHEIEVVKEHMEGIIKAVAYNLIVKLDPERASFYQVDTDKLYVQYELDIAKGYYAGRNGTNIRMPYAAETGTPYSSNLLF